MHAWVHAVDMSKIDASGPCEAGNDASVVPQVGRCSWRAGQMQGMRTLFGRLRPCLVWWRTAW